jgi:hypothetical protein
MYKGQANQDAFVLSILQYKRDGYFLEIGSNHPIDINNSYLLEKKYGWKGLMVDYEPSWEHMYKEHRTSPYIIADATTIDYLSLFKKYEFPKQMDYLQIDLEVNNESTIKTLELLESTIFPEYTFSTVTFEHDIYTGDHFDTRARSRAIFAKHGYILLFPNVSNGGLRYQFEDWYVHPSAFDADFIAKLKHDHDTMEHTEILNRIYKINPNHLTDTVSLTQNDVEEPMRFVYFYSPTYLFFHEHIQERLKDQFDLVPILIDDIRECYDGQHVFTGLTIKLELVIESIQKYWNETIIFSDATIFINAKNSHLLKDYVKQYDNYDIMFVDESVNKIFNIGFLTIKCNSTTLNFFKDALESFPKYNHDQATINYLLQDPKYSDLKFAVYDKQIYCDYFREDLRESFIIYKSFITHGLRKHNYNQRLDIFYAKGLIDNETYYKWRIP